MLFVQIKLRILLHFPGPITSKHSRCFLRQHQQRISRKRCPQKIRPQVAARAASQAPVLYGTWLSKKKKGYSPLLTYSPYAKNGAGISGILVNIPYMEHMGSTVCVSGACKLTFGSVSHEFSCSSTTGMGQNWVPQGPKVGQFRTGQSNCGRLHRRLTQRLSFMWLKQSWTIPQSSPFL